MKNQKTVSLITFAGVLLSTQALAIQTPDSIKTQSGIDLTPVLKSSIEKAEFNDSYITTLNPVVDAQLLDGTNTYTGFADLSFGLDSDVESNNYVDFTTGVNADFDIDPSNFVSVGLDVEFGHSATLDTDPEGDLTRSVTPSLNASYDYDFADQPATLRVVSNLSDTSYTNFDDITKFDELTQFGLATEYFYDKDAQTTFIGKLSFDTNKYKRTAVTGTKNSETYNLEAGVAFEASAITSGELRVGYLSKQYEKASVEDFAGLSWNGVLNWNPKSYSTVVVTTGFSVNDASGAEDYIGESTLGASWTHDWNSDWSSVASLNYTHENYEGLDQLDDTVEIDVTGFYSIAAESFKTDISFGTTFSTYASTGDASDNQEAVFNLGLDVML